MGKKNCSIYSIRHYCTHLLKFIHPSVLPTIQGRCWRCISKVAGTGGAASISGGLGGHGVPLAGPSDVQLRFRFPWGVAGVAPSPRLVPWVLGVLLEGLGWSSPLSLSKQVCTCVRVIAVSSISDTRVHTCCRVAAPDVGSGAGGAGGAVETDMSTLIASSSESSGIICISDPVEAAPVVPLMQVVLGGLGGLMLELGGAAGGLGGLGVLLGSS